MGHNLPTRSGTTGLRRSLDSPMPKHGNVRTPSCDLDSARHRPFHHLAAPNAPLYRAVLRSFVDAKAQFVVHLRTPDVVDALIERQAPVPPDEQLTIALGQLVEWGNLRDDDDTSRVSSVEDFHRVRRVYQLTPEGEAAERALEEFDRRLGRRGALQAVALADVETQLRQLRRFCDDDEPDAAAVAVALRDLVRRFADLADNAQAFMGSLQSTIDLHGVDVEAFLAYRDRLIDYLEHFLRELVTVGSTIAGLLPELDEAGIDRLLALVAAREAGDEVALEEDPVELEHTALERWRGQWRGLRRWFVDAPERPSQAQTLRRRARTAIPQLLEAAERLHEQREGRIDRAADFVELARWFAEAPSDADRHRLWRVAFGLHGARHLGVDADTLRDRRDAPVPSSTPWVEAPPIRISPQLRRTGSYERRGRPNRVGDRSAARARLRARAEAEAAQVAAARVRLITEGPVRLSALNEVDQSAFPLFLGLLGDALAARRPGDDAVAVTSADGALRVSLRPTGDGRWATIRTPDGVLRGPDHVLAIEEVA